MEFSMLFLLSLK